MSDTGPTDPPASPVDPAFAAILSATETALPRIDEALDELTDEFEVVGVIIRDCTGTIAAADQKGRGGAGRVRAAKEITNRLDEPIDRLATGCTDVHDMLQTVDRGLRHVIEHAPAALSAGAAPAWQVQDLFRTANDVAAKFDIVADASSRILDGARPLASKLRPLKPVVGQLRSAVSPLQTGHAVAREWLTMLDTAT